jgi:hypothetical protein
VWRGSVAARGRAQDNQRYSGLPGLLPTRKSLGITTRRGQRARTHVKLISLSLPRFPLCRPFCARLRSIRRCSSRVCTGIDPSQLPARINAPAMYNVIFSSTSRSPVAFLRLFIFLLLYLNGTRRENPVAALRALLF